MKRALLLSFFAIYSLVTLFPFYMLFVRSFVSTREATDLHLWIPGPFEVSEQTKIYQLMEFLQLTKPRMVRGFGLDSPSQLNNSMTLRQTSESTGVPVQTMKDYLAPIYRYHGWLYAAGNAQFFRSVLNSIIVTGLSLLLLIVLSILTSSTIAHFRRRWHFAVYNIYMLSLVVTPTFIIVPKFLLMNMLHLNDTYWALILPFAAGNALTIMIFTSFIATIPKELAESVYIDGGGRFRYLFSMVFPLCSTPIGAIIVVQMPVFWNNFFESMIFLSSERKYTLQVYLRSFIGQTTDDFQALYTTVLLSVVPMVIIYLASRRLFIKTLLSGAIKG